MAHRRPPLFFQCGEHDVMQLAVVEKKLDALLGEAVVGYSVAYPIGVIGPMLAMLIWQRLWRIDYASEFSSRIACRSGLGPSERSCVTFSSITTPDRSAHVWRASRNPDIGRSKKDCIGVGRYPRCC